MSDSSEQIQKYHACNDPNRPVCRAFVNQGVCYKRWNCMFYHPKVITRNIKQNARREPGYCYCGSILRTIIRGRRDEKLQYFVICSATSRSIKRCKN